MKKALLALTAGLSLVFCIGLSALYVRSADSPGAPAVSAGLSGRFSDRVNNAISHELEDLTYIRKIYRIPQGAAAPRPDPAGYGASDDPAVIQSVIDSAEALLDGQTITGWTPETELKSGSQVRYYVDDSILALVWQEVYDGTVCTFCEVKIGDASQLRRKLSGDSYGSGIQKTASQLAAEDNAVAAVNGDFYAFRSSGIRVWQGRLYLVRGWDIDSCFFTEDGDMLFARRGELTTWEDAARFAEENNISFSVTFGPVLVDGGVNITPWEYPLGEINQPYSRSVIGQVDTLHYLMMTTNFEPGYMHAVLARTAGDLMIARGCQRAYSLDGGQTATIHLGGELMCNPDFGWEREISDIICFASAVPEGGTS